ncbi:hypothetical protein BB559_000617 [Furculomyces boomerangus]|uniref:Glycine cleavage system H protein n=2 Tax=Harpellales TaxID=61421 RepID=A0A2T9Y330_9FUNG|nr:hypothetical protein BB559_006419 [Furculomyces boomerangus]PVU99555.1 hypothetical protein BB559_000617 [Furculomyces boomerangus]PVZ99588.1 hypothetical protein BB558_004387 [Smittium angustum]
MSFRIISKGFFSKRMFSVLPTRFYATKKYTASHEWIEVENGVGTVGITDHAQSALGDVVYVETPEPGTEIEIEGQVGAVESVKAASDLYSPVSGEIIEANALLATKPKLINQSPEKDGWLFKIKLSDETELDQLLDEAKYNELVGEESE